MSMSFRAFSRSSGDQTMRTIPIAAASIIVALLAPLAAQAACSHTALRFESGTHQRIQMNVVRNTECTVYAQAGSTSQASGIASFLGVRVSRKPVSGIAGVASKHEWAYKPNPGFVGRDRFSVEITFVRNTQSVPQTLLVDVDVTVN
jgi:hypothetical protein